MRSCRQERLRLKRTGQIRCAFLYDIIPSLIKQTSLRRVFCGPISCKAMDRKLLEYQIYNTVPSIRFVVSDCLQGSRKGPDVFFTPPLVFLVLRVKKKTKKNKRHRHGSSKTRPQLTTERKPDHAIGSLGLTPPHLTEIDPGPHVRIWDRARSVPDASRSVKGGRVEARAVCDRMSHRGGIKDTLFCFR